MYGTPREELRLEQDMENMAAKKMGAKVLAANAEATRLGEVSGDDPPPPPLPLPLTTGRAALPSDAIMQALPASREWYVSSAGRRALPSSLTPPLSPAWRQVLRDDPDTYLKNECNTKDGLWIVIELPQVPPPSTHPTQPCLGGLRAKSAAG